MITLQLDPIHFETLLRVRGITANQLSHLLIIRHYPSPSVLNSWLHDGPVAARWRAAIARTFHIGEEELFDKTGCMYKAAMREHSVTERKLSAVSIEETVTRGAITNWKRGGGIEPDKLIALAELLDVQPASLLSTQTQDLIRRLLSHTPRVKPTGICQRILTVPSPVTLVGCLMFVMLLGLS